MTAARKPRKLTRIKIRVSADGQMSTHVWPCNGHVVLVFERPNNQCALYRFSPAYAETLASQLLEAAAGEQSPAAARALRILRGSPK